MDPSIALGLLLMGMAIGALLTRESYRRNVQSVLDEEIEKQSLYGDLPAYPSSQGRQPDTRPLTYQATRLTGGHSPRQVN